jgi:hypothetical protein
MGDWDWVLHCVMLMGWNEMHNGYSFFFAIEERERERESVCVWERDSTLVFRFNVFTS